jgi:hypothetical protein
MDALVRLADVDPSDPEASALAEHSATTPFTDDDTLGVLKDLRERGMAAKIKSVDTPTLVRLGDAHADPVAKQVGGRSMLVRHPKTIDDVSRLSVWTGAVEALKAMMKAPR